MGRSAIVAAVLGAAILARSKNADPKAQDSIVTPWWSLWILAAFGPIAFPMLSPDPEIPAVVRARYRAFTVDEYQDVNQLQQSLLELWIGALERISKAGITRLAAIHRGFSSSDKATYRNKPKWEIPIELKRLIPDLPVFCDPSHICGNTALIPSVAQQAIDLHFDGLMIEAHINPQAALSDAKQQLTPEELARLLADLVYKRPFVEDTAFSTGLERLRAVIDRIDTDLIDLIARRMSVVEEIGRLKEESGVMIYQPGRWDEIVKSRVKAGAGRNLSEEFVFALFQSIHQEAIAHQTKARDRDGKDR